MHNRLPDAPFATLQRSRLHELLVSAALNVSAGEWVAA